MWEPQWVGGVRNTGVLEQGWTRMGSEWFWGDKRGWEVCARATVGTASTSRQ